MWPNRFHCIITGTGREERSERVGDMPYDGVKGVKFETDVAFDYLLGILDKNF